MAGPFATWLARARSWWFSRRDDEVFDEELQTHLSLAAAEYERGGATPEDAARRARLDFGGLTQLKEAQRDRRGLPALDTLLQDMRYGLRVFRRERVFTAGAVLTLAIGIGANTAMFSLLNGYLKPLPVPDPLAIVAIGGETRGDEYALGQHKVSFPTIADLRARAVPFTDIFGYTPWIAGLQADGRTTSFLFSAVTDNFFTGLRLTPALGRLFQPGDGERPGSPHLVVLGYSCWQHRFGGNPAVINTPVRINGQLATIIGVAPRGFVGLYAGTEMAGYVTIDTLSAVGLTPSTHVFTDRGLRIFTLFGRLRDHTTMAAAEQTIDVAARAIEQAHPDTDRNRALHLYPERLARPFPQRALASAVPTVSLSVLVLAALVLGLACMNVSNLFFVRAMARQREQVVRAALGASRSRLIRQSLTESLMLAGAGGLAGVLAGAMGQRMFVAAIDIGTDFPLAVNFDFDWRVFVYALAAATAAGVAVGLWPAVRASRADAASMLHDGGRTHSGGRVGQRVRSALAIGQLAGALVLLSVAGIFVQHLFALQQLDLGFDAVHVLNARLDPHQLGYDDARTTAFYDELERRVRQWPETAAASLAFSVPLGYFGLNSELFIDERPVPPDTPAPSSDFNRVDTGYFSTLQIPLVEGRDFRDEDRRADAHVVIVNRTMAETFWPGQSAIGKTFRIDSRSAPPLRIVGVARDSKYVLIFEQPRPYFYVPLTAGEQSLRVMQVRTTVPPETLAPKLEREIHAIDPDMPIADLQTMRASLGGAMGFMMYRLGAYQAVSLGLLGLALSLLGVYGVISHSTTQRTREIGIRIALGARPSSVVRLILRQGLMLVGAGLLLGGAGAWAASRVMSQVFTVARQSSAPALIGVSATLAIIAITACYVPARRAMGVDPVTALRHE